MLLQACKECDKLLINQFNCRFVEACTKSYLKITKFWKVPNAIVAFDCF